LPFFEILPRTLTTMRSRIRFFLGGVVLCAAMSLSGCRDSVTSRADVPTLYGETPEQVYGDKRVAELVTAAAHGDAAKVAALAKGGADVNAISSEGFTPLMWAQTADNLAGLEALLKAGADPNLRIKQMHEYTVMEGAAGGPRPRQLEVLLAHGGNPNLSVPQGHGTALLGVAARNGQVENVKLLIEAGANINFHTESSLHTCLDDAIGAGRYDIALGVKYPAYVEPQTQ
jgi:ankyrin repeat protein